jgi:hypothetical protein
MSAPSSRRSSPSCHHPTWISRRTVPPNSPHQRRRRRVVAAPARPPVPALTPVQEQGRSHRRGDCLQSVNCQLTFPIPSTTPAPIFRAPAHKHAHHLHSIPPREKSTRTLIIDHLLWVHARTRFAQARAELAMTDRTGGPGSPNYAHRERPELWDEDEGVPSDSEGERADRRSALDRVNRNNSATKRKRGLCGGICRSRGDSGSAPRRLRRSSPVCSSNPRVTTRFRWTSLYFSHATSQSCSR